MTQCNSCKSLIQQIQSIINDQIHSNHMEAELEESYFKKCNETLEQFAQSWFAQEESKDSWSLVQACASHMIQV